MKVIRNAIMDNTYDSVIDLAEPDAVRSIGLKVEGHDLYIKGTEKDARLIASVYHGLDVNSIRGISALCRAVYRPGLRGWLGRLLLGVK